MAEERPRLLDAVIYAAKAAVSAVAAVVVFDRCGLPGAGWAAVSAVIVSQPTLHPSWHASLTRVTANLIGAAIGAVLAGTLGHTLLSLGIGVALTGLTCHFLKLDEVLRPAYAAVVIVLFNTDSGSRVWEGSRDRVVSVVLGCVCALAVGFVFDKAATLLRISRRDGAPNHEGTE
jgi:uncharacterized membrane protein YgaE (UPF0421/DUF939 family)